MSTKKLLTIVAMTTTVALAALYLSDGAFVLTLLATLVFLLPPQREGLDKPMRRN